MQITIHAAKSQLSRLIEAALAGEEVIIAKGASPVVRLQPIRAGSFVMGPLKAELAGVTPDFLEPLDEDALSAWEGA